MSGHVNRAQGQQLGQLKAMILEMGGRASRQVTAATEALLAHDPDAAGAIIADDAVLDAQEKELEAFCIRLLALRQPMGADLRLVIAALKISHILERVGDYAANMAKRSLALGRLPPLGSLNGFRRMATLVAANLDEALAALAAEDVERADRVWAADEPVDAIYNGIFRELLTHMMEDPRAITPATHLLFMAKNLERIGDHATAIAEVVHYAVRGDSLPPARPKGNAGPLPVVMPPG